MVAGAGPGIGDFIGFAGGENTSATLVPGMSGTIAADHPMQRQPRVYIGTGDSDLAGRGELVAGPGVPVEQALASLRRVVVRFGVAQTPAAETGRALGHPAWAGRLGLKRRRHRGACPLDPPRAFRRHRPYRHAARNRDPLLCRAPARGAGFRPSPRRNRDRCRASGRIRPPRAARLAGCRPARDAAEFPADDGRKHHRSHPAHAPASAGGVRAAAL